MRFTDFRMRDLIGKPVLWTIGGQGKGTIKTITKIRSCGDTGFTIEGESDDRIFNYRNGHQKALTGRMEHTISFCQLLDEEKIIELRDKWEQDKYKQQLVETIRTNVDKLINVPVQHLENLVLQINQ